MSEFYWRTADGRTLKLSELKDDHLKNIIRLYNKRKKADKIPAQLQEEYYRRFGGKPSKPKQDSSSQELIEKFANLEKENSMLREELFKYKNCKIHHLT